MGGEVADAELHAADHNPGRETGQTALVRFRLPGEAMFAEGDHLQRDRTARGQRTTWLSSSRR
jgi:hypothetical protein